MRRPLLLNPKIRPAATSRFRPGLAELVLRASRGMEAGESVSVITPPRRQLAKATVVSISNAPNSNKEST